MGKTHNFCKRVLANKRKRYGFGAQWRITAEVGLGGHWNIYVYPIGLIGSYEGCCRWRAMGWALDDEFCPKSPKRYAHGYSLRGNY